MGFLAPWFLAGLTLLGVPVYLHLLERRQAKIQQFSSLMFFERSITASVRRRRLRHLLLLAARLALLALIVLAFARPFFRSTAFAERKGNLLIVVDESASMGAQGVMDRAKDEASKILAGKPASRTVRIAGLSTRLRTITKDGADSAPHRAAISSLTATDSRGSYSALSQSLRAQPSQDPIEVHLITDLQRTSVPSAIQELQLPDNVTLHVHSVASKAAPNWTVESVVAPPRVQEPEKARVQAIVAGFGTQESTRNVVLRLNGKDVARKVVTVPAGGRVPVEFTGLPAAYGFSRGEVAIEPSDELKTDDRFFFAVERTDPRPVLFVTNEAASRALLYYRAALDAAAPGAYKLETASYAQAGGMPLSRFAFVVLADPGPLPPNVEAEWKRYVEGGGAVLVLAGPNTAKRTAMPLTQDPVDGTSYAARQADRYWEPSLVDTAHPTFAPGTTLQGVRVLQGVRFEPKSSRIVARLSNGAPWVAEAKLGAGRVLIVSALPDTISSDFPLHPAFVPFVERSGHWLSGWSNGVSQRTVGDAAALRESSLGTAPEVLDPSGRSALTIMEAASARSIELPRAGFWEIRRGQGRSEIVAVNIDRREADLALLPAETAALWEGKQPAVPAADTQAAATSTKDLRRPLWHWLLALAIAAAVAELWLAYRNLSEETA